MAFIYNNTATYFQVKRDFETLCITDHIEPVEYFEDELIPPSVTKDIIVPMNLVRVVEVKNNDAWWMFGTLRADPEDITVIYENANEAPGGIILKYRYKVTITMLHEEEHPGIEPLTLYQDSDTPITSRMWKAIRKAAFFYMKSAREKAYEEILTNKFFPSTFAVWVQVERVDRGTTIPKAVVNGCIKRELNSRYDQWWVYTKRGVRRHTLWADKNHQEEV